MNTIKVRFTDIRRWAASQLTGLAMTIYNDDEHADVSMLKDAYANMENVYIQSFDDWRNDEATQEGLDEIVKELDFDTIINSFDDPVANAWKKLIPTQQAKQADTNEH